MKEWSEYTHLEGIREMFAERHTTRTGDMPRSFAAARWGEASRRAVAA